MPQVTYQQVSTLPCFVVFTDYCKNPLYRTVDIVLHDKVSAAKHARELRNKYGCTGVKVVQYESEQAFWQEQGCN
jgi:hypothetical protein